MVDGRWTWTPPVTREVEVKCPACRRIEDRLPAGYVTLEGPFLSEHRREIMNLVDNVAEAEKGEHPLERIMAIHRDPEVTVITTTGVHLARRLGDRIHRSYYGELAIHYEYEGKGVRVEWKR